METYLDLPKRTVKPRKNGITSIHDVRHTVRELEHILEEHQSFVDVAKLGVGTALVVPKLKEKIACYAKHDIDVYFGGTLFEKFYHQDKLEDYQRFMSDHNIGLVEVSEGTLDIPIEERLQIIETFKKNFNVLAEVGSKDADAIMPPSQWLYEIRTFLDAGCSYVITEGRNSGTAGIYRQSGEIRTGLVSDIIDQVDASKLIFEAPTPSSQMFFINQVGANVNLGNVNPMDLLLLETQRRALRSETFFLK